MIMIGCGRPSRPDAARLGLWTSPIELPHLSSSIAPAARPVCSYSSSTERLGTPAPAPRVHLAAPAAAPPPAPVAPTAVPAPLPAPLDDADKRRQRKEKRRALAWKPSGLASCYGCSPDAEGGEGHTGV